MLLWTEVSKGARTLGEMVYAALRSSYIFHLIQSSGDAVGVAYCGKRFSADQMNVRPKMEYMRMCLKCQQYAAPEVHDD